MSKKARIGVLVVALFIGVSLIGAAAFTTATLQRDANIDVVTDANGIIALQDGTSGGIVSVKSNGELTIDFTKGGAISNAGVNVESVYKLGNPSNQPSGEYAFSITNRDTVTHTITLNYTVTSGDGVGNGVNNTEFKLFDGGTNVLTISEEGNGGSITLPNGATRNVTVVVDTVSGSGPGSLTDADDLSGTLNITAT